MACPPARVVTAEPLAHIKEDGRVHLLWDHIDAVGRWVEALAPRDDLRAALPLVVDSDFGRGLSLLVSARSVG